MKNILWLLLVVTNISLAQNSLQEFPKGPIVKLTPGELCDRPVSYRYPENIAYCDRLVSTELKDEVFANYRKNGYRLSYANRADYKVDHYFPLCAGGSNNSENLWPQHISIASVTDSIEQMGCDKMSKGKLTQAKFILMIKRAKNDLAQAIAVQNEISRL